MSPERRPMPRNEWLTKMSEANRARAKIEPLVFPLASRRVPRSEIVKITNLTYRKVNSAIYRMELKDEIRRPSKEETSEAHRRLSLGRKRAESRQYTSEEQHAFALAREFLVAGFIGDDLSSWNKLHSIYAVHQRKLPYNFADRLHLEVYLAALLANKRGEIRMTPRYLTTGNRINPEWFSRVLIEDRKFIDSIIDEGPGIHNNKNSGSARIPGSFFLG